jgi:2'-5' RNA ligase
VARLFVAFVPPEAVTAALAEAVARVRPLAPELGWVPPERWHVTVAFLGEVDDARRPALDERLARVARRHAPAHLRLAGAGHFGRHALTYRVAGAVTPLVNGVRRAAARAGIVGVDDRSPSPHLTLARVRPRRPADLGPLVAALDAAVIPAWAAGGGPSWTADRITLIRSRAGAGGSRGPSYEEQSSWALGPASSSLSHFDSEEH